ncbi:MAG: CaiB/BaiF CoA transferase family protein [Chloroflexota bacterium]
MTPAALSGITILDLTRVLAGPYGTMIMGDFGAEVIKIEQPGRGDDTRRWGPPFDEHGESAYYQSVNRNKRSVTLNLKTAEGREVLRELARQADVLVENFKVGTMDRLGLGYEALRELNAGLVYCAITGYGQDGPYAKRPGYDTVIQAQGGLMSITGPADGEPFKVGVAIVDITAGLYAVISILAALKHRQRSGEGQFVDIALFDAQLSWLANVASSYLMTGETPGRYGNAHATIVPYQVFATADGRMMVAVGNDGQFSALCEVVGRPAWAEDERFASNAARVENREVLVDLLQGRFSKRPTEAWIEALLDAAVPCGPVNDVPAALENEQSVARNMVQTVTGAHGDELRLVGPAPKMNVTPPLIRIPPPSLGQHTEEVLRERLGYDAERIEQLRAVGAID